MAGAARRSSPIRTSRWSAAPTTQISTPSAWACWAIWLPPEADLPHRRFDPPPCRTAASARELVGANRRDAGVAAMPTRRFLLMAGVAGLALGGTLSAEARSPHGRGRHANQAPAAPTDPATTPLGPMDTKARWAYGMDYTSGATLPEKHADEP